MAPNTPVHVTDTAYGEAVYPTLQAAMTAVVARYPEAVFSDIDFDHEPTIWVWPTNDASKHADAREAVAWICQQVSPSGSGGTGEDTRMRRVPGPLLLLLWGCALVGAPGLLALLLVAWASFG